MSRVVKGALLVALMLALSAGVALAATIVGTAGVNNIAVGFTGENDQIFLLEGNDSADPYDGNDAVYGNEGNDTVLGSEDSDKVYGNSGNDIVDLDSFDSPGSTDQGWGGAGNDTVYAQDGNFDVIQCGVGTSDVAFVDPGDNDSGCESVNPTTATASKYSPPER